MRLVSVYLIVAVTSQSFSSLLDGLYIHARPTTIYSYGYTSPPPGNDSISLLSQNLLLSMQAQSQNSGCLTQPQSCANPPPTAPVCNDLNQSPPTIYESKFDIISTFNPYTWWVTI